NGVFGVDGAGFDEAIRIKGFRKSGQRKAAEFFVFVRDSRDQVQVLGRDDLIGVDVVPQNVNGAAKDSFRHDRSLGRGWHRFNLKEGDSKIQSSKLKAQRKFKVSKFKVNGSHCWLGTL